jgi:hypothetical protein
MYRLPDHEQEDCMVCAAFVRRLRHARRMDDEREILSVGLVDVGLDEVPALMERVGAAEARRHDSIDHVIEETTFRGLYEVVAQVDLS